MINYNVISSKQGCGPSSYCLDKFGCPNDRCPDFIIRRHDTRPPLKVSVSDCDGPLDLTGLVVEANMWAKAKLKTTIEPDTTYFAVADGIGFDQMLVGDVIVVDHVRSPEYMLVVGFDEVNKLVLVERGYRNTTPLNWKKGTAIRIFRMMDSPAQSEMVFDDVENVDGTTTKNVLTSSALVYEWNPEDTCLPGCYWLEFKLLKMLNLVVYLPGGIWSGPTHTDANGVFYTGTYITDSSVQLSFNSVKNEYLLPTTVWKGSVNIYSSNYYTGNNFDDGSVMLSTTNVVTQETTDFSSPLDSVVIPSGVSLVAPSTIPPSVSISFIEQGATPRNFGCYLGEGVEWVRRFPIDGEGFLIKINQSPTMEF